MWGHSQKRKERKKGRKKQSYNKENQQSQKLSFKKTKKFDKLLKKTDLVITGEGCFDKTGMGNGKAVDAVISHARKQRVPVVVIAGSSEAEADTDSCEVICLIEEGMTKQYAMEHASELLERKAEELFVRIGKSGGSYCKK